MELQLVFNILGTLCAGFLFYAWSNKGGLDFTIKIVVLGVALLGAVMVTKSLIALGLI